MRAFVGPAPVHIDFETSTRTSVCAIEGCITPTLYSKLTQLHGHAGEPWTIKSAVCMHEEDAGILWCAPLQSEFHCNACMMLCLSGEEGCAVLD